MKLFHGQIHVYCAGSEIKVGGLAKECPDKPFYLPVTAEFNISGRSYQGVDFRMKLEESVDPWFTMKANMFFQPKAIGWIH